MKESLERQDSAAVFELLGQHERAVRQAAEHRARFNAAFDKAAANITEIGEPEMIAAIRSGRDDYYRRFDEFLAATGDRTAQYFRVLEPRFNARPRRLRSPAAPESGGDAPEGRPRVGDRAPLVLHHARSGPDTDGRRRGRGAQPVERHRRPGAAADGGDDQGGGGRSRRRRARAVGRRNRHARVTASTGWPSGFASCADRISASCSSRSRRPKRPSTRSTIR